MENCKHDGDQWWEHTEKRTYCCQCRQPVPPRVVPVLPRPKGGRVRPSPRLGEHYDHYGYPCAPGQTGADQT